MPAGALAKAARSHGEVHVVSRVVGFKKIKFYTNENVGSGELDLPEQQMHTSWYWLTIPSAVMLALPFSTDDRRDGVIGLAFAMRNIAQLLLMCDRHDIGLSIDGGTLERSTRTGGPGGIPSGSGGGSQHFHLRQLSRRHRIQQAALRDALVASRADRDLIGTCPCESGCPSCVGPEGNTGPQAKAVALHLLDKSPAAAGRAGRRGHGRDRRGGN